MDREGIPLEIQKRALQNLGLDPNEFNDVTQKRRERPQTPTERREIYKSIIRDWTFNQFQPLLETLQRGTPLTQYSPELQSIINHDIHSVLDETDPLYQKTYRELIGEIPPGVILLVDKLKQRLSEITDVSTAKEQYQILFQIIEKIKNAN